MTELVQDIVLDTTRSVSAWPRLQQELQLVDAIKNNDSTLVKQLLDSGAKINKRRGHEVPLCVAAEKGNPDILKLLIDHGADLRCRTPHDLHAFDIAVRNGHLDCLKVLVGAGWKVKKSTKQQDPPLYCATANGMLDVVEYLLDLKVCVNEKASPANSKNTALHVAAQLADTSLIRKLVSNGAMVNARNENREQPVHFAATTGQTANIRLLLDHGSNVNDSNWEGCTPLLLAAQHGHAAAVRELYRAGAQMDYKNHKGCNVFHLAVDRGHMQVLRVAQLYGANVNAKEHVRQWTPLHLAITKCAHKMKDTWEPNRSRVAINREIEMLDTLLQAGADINALDSQLQTPLHLCVTEGCAFAMEYLINSHADVTRLTKHGATVLTLACEKNVSQAIHLLIQQCPLLVSHPEHHRSHRSSPFCILIRKKNTACLKMLREAGYVLGKEELQWCLTLNRQKISSDIRSWIEEEVQQPWSLQQSCKYSIRHHLGTGITMKAPKLPIPQKLRDYIMLT